MNNHQKSTFHQFGNFLNPALALLGLALRKLPNGQKLNSANHPYLCKGLIVDKAMNTILGQSPQITHILSIIPMIAASDGSGHF